MNKMNYNIHVHKHFSKRKKEGRKSSCYYNKTITKFALAWLSSHHTHTHAHACTKFSILYTLHITICGIYVSGNTQYE